MNTYTALWHVWKCWLFFCCVGSSKMENLNKEHGFMVRDYFLFLSKFGLSNLDSVMGRFAINGHDLEFE